MGRPDGPPKGFPPSAGGNQENHQGSAPFSGSREERPPLGNTSDEQDTDLVDGNIRKDYFYHHSYSTVDEVNEQTSAYIHSFLEGRMQRDGISMKPSLNRQSMGVNVEVARCLQLIGDELSNNSRLNGLIDSCQVSSETAFETFASVAAQIFEDGTVNWGRVVALFYFAYRLALKCISELKLVQTIINWVCRFVTERLANWISDRGGWVAIREYFGSTSAQMAGVFLAGCVFMALVFYVNKS